MEVDREKIMLHCDIVAIATQAFNSESNIIIFDGALIAETHLKRKHFRSHAFKVFIYIIATFNKEYWYNYST